LTNQSRGLRSWRRWPIERFFIFRTKLAEPHSGQWPAVVNELRSANTYFAAAAKDMKVSASAIRFNGLRLIRALCRRLSRLPWWSPLKRRLSSKWTCCSKVREHSSVRDLHGIRLPITIAYSLSGNRRDTTRKMPWESAMEVCQLTQMRFVSQNGPFAKSVPTKKNPRRRKRELVVACIVSRNSANGA